MDGTSPAAERPLRSDVDFADVFGGPPRRSSGHDSLRRSSMDSSSFGSAPRARSGPEERPVFGERTSSDRRRQLGEEFYKDIFAGSESVSPRRAGAAGDLDVFGAQASPGSMSRRRTSFSMKFNNGGMDSSVPTSPSRHTSNKNDDGASYAYSIPTSPNSSMNSFLGQGAPQQESRKNPFSWHRYPFISRFRSHSGDRKDTSHYVSSMDSECEGTPVSLDSCIDNNTFHFSFYKWGGKGAILVLPTTAQENAGDIVGMSFPQVIVQGMDLIDEEDNMSTATGASKSQIDHEDYKSGKDGLFNTRLKTKDGALPLVFDEYMKGNKAKETGSKLSTENAKDNAIGASPNSKSSRSSSGEKSRGSRVKEKVKDFIKIFSPESSPKRKGAPEAHNRTSNGKNGSRGGPEDKFSMSSLEVDEDVRTSNMNNRNMFPTATSPMSEVQDKTEIPVFTVDNETETRADNLFGRKKVTPPSFDEDKVGETTEHEESPVEDLEECVVEDVSDEFVLRNNEDKELLKVVHMVLWPESGWKPVPLVDIIEGAAVKKAYQKALLCLHPDKLQQRGAAMHQKYIAEKVFDILQESWKEFNSVTFG
ncbi:hypothetical protein GUJ93_ZPchr0006g43339 [Zizania palustris]|uniref:J domain-containing protein n=1 Tax=Zizania palustris TaxID=103762 RepID=A0A8J5T477_ZIZPA|nr:hypothetical protein GUJ93_ZPchr0006g43339 [Zizania palustris]